MKGLSLQVVLVLSWLAFTTVLGFRTACDGIFDTYECDDGTCVLDMDKCDGSEDCPDGSDEGAETCGHIIGGVVGSVIGGILLCCVLPCVCVCCLVYWSNRQRVRPVNTTVTTHPAQPTTYPLQTAPYQPYVPPPVVQTSNFASQPVSDFVSHQPEPQPSAPPQLPNAQLFNAEPPPPYPATGYATFTAPPQAPAPGYDVAYEQKAMDFPGQDS